jgi:uncharacterized membrane-anchored protein
LESHGTGANERKFITMNSQSEQGNLTTNWKSWLDLWCDWIDGRKLSFLLVGVAFQFIVLIAMIALPLTTLVTGDTILLRVVPIDPRDLLRGDYVILNYRISQLPSHGIPGLDPSEQEGATVFVKIEPEDDGMHWREGKISLYEPPTGKFIRGEIHQNRIEFGIESYFVQEGEGLEYEQAARLGILSAEIALDRTGKAVLKRLVIE